jgi:hypothetical protein
MENSVKSNTKFHKFGYVLFAKHLVFDLLGLCGLFFIDVILLNLDEDIVGNYRIESGAFLADSFIFFMLHFIAVLCVTVDVLAIFGMAKVSLIF